MPVYEPSVGEELQHPLQDFVSGLDKFLKPNKAFQEGMQKALGANPQLAQDLADLEYNAPGTLGKMGFGDLGKILSQVPESVKSQAARASRGVNLDTAQKQAQLANTETGFSLENLQAAIHLMHSDPNVAADVIHKTLLGKTIAESKGVEIRNRLETAQGDIAQAELPGIQAKAKAEADLQTLRDQHPELKDFDVVGAVRSMIHGGPTPPNLQLLMSTEQGRAAFDNARIIAELGEQRNLRLQMHAAGLKQDKAEERAKIQTAAMAQRTTHVGTFESWRTVLEDPEAVQAIQAKQQKGETLSQDDRDVIASANAQQEQIDRQQSAETRKGAGDVYKEIGALRAAHSTAELAIKRGDDDAGVNFALSGLNELLAQRGAKTGGITYQAVRGPIPDVGKAPETAHTSHVPFMGADVGLFYIDPNTGLRVKDNAPFQIPKSAPAATTKTTTQAKLSADGARALAQIQDPKVDKKAALEALRKKDPTLAAEVEPYIKP